MDICVHGQLVIKNNNHLECRKIRDGRRGTQ